MAILTNDEIFFTSFEPKLPNRYYMYLDGFPSYIIKGIGGLGFDQGEITLNHINVYRKIKGKLRWNDLNLTLFDPITPSGAQAVMEWVRLHHESVTGRDGYSDFYKKDVVIDIVGPVGDIVSEWVAKGAFIKSAAFGDLGWDEDGNALQIQMTLGMDYMVLNF
jgi:hypothetical protein